MPRHEEQSREALSPQQQRVYDELTAGPRKSVPPPHQVWLNSPVLCDTAQQLGVHCRFSSSLPPHLSELAILVTGRHFRAAYEWWAHARLAREAGVSDDVIEAIRTGAKPDFSGADPRSAIVVKAAREMIATHRLSDATFQQADSELGRQGLVDLVGIVGYYCLVSLTLNVFEIQVPDGSDPFADLGAA